MYFNIEMFITLIQNLYRKAKATTNLKSPNIFIEDKLVIPPYHS